MAVLQGTVFPVWVRQEITPVTTQVITMSGITNWLVLLNSGTIAALTINLPTNPVDGQFFNISNVGAVTAVTYSPTVLGAAAGLAAGQCPMLVYSSTLATPGWLLFD